MEALCVAKQAVGEWATSSKGGLLVMSLGLVRPSGPDGARRGPSRYNTRPVYFICLGGHLVT